MSCLLDPVYVKVHNEWYHVMLMLLSVLQGENKMTEDAVRQLVLDESSVNTSRLSMYGDERVPQKAAPVIDGAWFLCFSALGISCVIRLVPFFRLAQTPLLISSASSKEKIPL